MPVNDARSLSPCRKALESLLHKNSRSHVGEIDHMRHVNFLPQLANRVLKLPDSKILRRPVGSQVEVPRACLSRQPAARAGMIVIET